MPDKCPPWMAQYPADLATGDGTRPSPVLPLAMLAENVRHRPADVALHYFDASMTWEQVDNAASALARLLVSRAFRPGDRLAIVMQNNPAFVIGLLAAWKAGGMAALVSPLSKHRELSDALADCRPSAMLVLDDVYHDVAREVLAAGNHSVHLVVTASALDGQTRNDLRLFAGAERRRVTDAIDLAALVLDGPPVEVEPPSGGDVAVLAHTSGTTGTAKAAMLTHHNLAFNARTYRDWARLGPDDGVLLLAPAFHVSGLVGGVLLSLLLGSPLVMTHRFMPAVVLDAITQRRPAFAVASVTAYIALVDDGGATASDMESFHALFCGGSPLEPAVAERLELALGHYLHNVYGQTETTSPSHIVPTGRRAPVDEATEALSVGVPVFDTTCRVIDDEGRPLPAGEIGELVTRGPQVCAGYWERPGETADAMPDGEVRTGDVGFMDVEGWFYIVDRRTDVINASAFKIWPREVEQVLLSHPEVREAAVVGMADDYRGESVKAFVCLQPGSEVTELDLIQFSKERLAAYKYPREIELIDNLPRTATGKLMRHVLRGT